jgi:hypothetical protein
MHAVSPVNVYVENHVKHPAASFEVSPDQIRPWLGSI